MKQYPSIKQMADYTLPIATETQKPKLTDLLLKEMEETNNWARLGCQLYFAWFAVVLAANGAGISLIFQYAVEMRNSPVLGRVIFVIFILWNVFGVAATILIHNLLLKSGERIQKILEGFNHGISSDSVKPTSPVPKDAVHTAFGFTAAGLIVLLAFWTFMLCRSIKGF